ncbi:hypothetical protein J9B83_12555 [Marinomonas sp. A79]|uniref:Uncharacterized protein n=1 Tax=Marinomonas vulgaris TaxID=2823372 RepID=A0ABS5HDP3_9GAMM|nr:hypothetical protein [Marinomonas vulgaris]MBR7889765.1 hypothetical protein [Marinomonas vulgaris]
MPSYNQSPNASHNGLEIEIIQPADGRGETRYFLSICVGTLLLAGVLLSLLHSPSQQTLPELPVSHSNMATQISNALEEIALLEEADMISPPYQLQQLPLPTIGQTAFAQQDKHCFTLHQAGILFAVEREAQHWAAHWAQSDKELDCHASLVWHPLNR